MPSSQSTSRIITMVQSIFGPPYPAILRRSDSFLRKDPLRACFLGYSPILDFGYSRIKLPLLQGLVPSSANFT